MNWKQKISQGKIEEVLHDLILFYLDKSPDILNELVILSSRYRYWLKWRNLGVSTDDSELRKIEYLTLQIVDLTSTNNSSNYQNENIKSKDEDVEIIRFFRECFDRPAFLSEVKMLDNFGTFPAGYSLPSYERCTFTNIFSELIPKFRGKFLIDYAFDQALEDTITALNTGCLFSRNSRILKKNRSKSYLKNNSWRRRIELITAMIINIRFVINKNRNSSSQTLRELACWIADEMNEIKSIFNSICEEALIPKLTNINHNNE